MPTASFRVGITMSFYSIQYMRFIAAFLVLIYHVPISPKLVEGWAATIQHAKGFFGPVGVDLFFIISGFVMCHNMITTKISGTSFFVRRVTRIVPLYWAVTLIHFFMPEFFKVFDDKLGMAELFKSLFFIAAPYPASETGEYYPVYSPGWTINYEMFFYLLLGLILFAFKNESREKLVYYCCGLLCILAAAGHLFNTQGFLRFYTSSILLEFVLGMIIGLCVVRLLLLPKSFAILFILLGIVSLAIYPNLGSITEQNRFFFWGVPSALIIYGMVSLENHSSFTKLPFMKFLGDISYAIYLTHFFIIGVLMTAFNLLGLPFNGIWMIIYIGLGLTLSVGFGGAVYHYVEVPILRKLR